MLLRHVREPSKVVITSRARPGNHEIAARVSVSVVPAEAMRFRRLGRRHPEHVEREAENVLAGSGGTAAGSLLLEEFVRDKGRGFQVSQGCKHSVIAWAGAP